MAEWLRRWTRNPLGSPHAGSNSANNGCSHLVSVELINLHHESAVTLQLAISSPLWCYKWTCLDLKHCEITIGFVQSTVTSDMLWSVHFDIIIWCVQSAEQAAVAVKSKNREGKNINCGGSFCWIKYSQKLFFLEGLLRQITENMLVFYTHCLSKCKVKKWWVAYCSPSHDGTGRSENSIATLACSILWYPVMYAIILVLLLCPVLKHSQYADTGLQ